MKKIKWIVALVSIALSLVFIGCSDESSSSSIGGAIAKIASRFQRGLFM